VVVDVVVDVVVVVVVVGGKTPTTSRFASMMLALLFAGATSKDVEFTSIDPPSVSRLKLVLSTRTVIEYDSALPFAKAVPRVQITEITEIPDATQPEGNEPDNDTFNGKS
jgi:hypothetical protein